MTIRRGITAVRDAKTKMDSGGGNRRKLILKDGETFVGRFIGNFEDEQDPVVFDIHYVKRLPPGSQYNNCAKNGPDGHAGCVFCHLKQTGDKGISHSQRAGFYVHDRRKYHKLENEVTILKPGKRVMPGKAADPKDYYKTKYPPCNSAKGNCQWCKGGNEAVQQGFRDFEASVSVAEQLLSQIVVLREYCLCGARDEEGNGTIYITKYQCSNPDCGSEVEFYPEQGKAVASCGECGQVLTPLEIIACTGCKEPRRACMQDFLFRVSRTGDGQDTTYNFEPVHPVQPMTAEEIEEAKKYAPDWEKLTHAQPAEMQAAALGIPCPFQTPGHGAVKYDESESEVDGDVPARASIKPPARKAPAPAKPAPKAPAKPAPKPALKPKLGGTKPVVRSSKINFG